MPNSRAKGFLIRTDSRHCGCSVVVPERNRRHLCDKISGRQPRPSNDAPTFQGLTLTLQGATATSLLSLLEAIVSVPVVVWRGLVHHFLVLANIILPARSQKDRQCALAKCSWTFHRACSYSKWLLLSVVPLNSRPAPYVSGYMLIGIHFC